MHWVRKRIFERTKSQYNIFLAGNGHGEEIHEVGKYFDTLFKAFWNITKIIRKLHLNTTGLLAY